MLFGRGDPTLESVVDRVEPAAVLHAGDQPVREAADRSDSRQRLDLRVPRGRRPDPAARFRDLPGDRGRRAWRRRRHRAAVPAVLFGVQRGRRAPVSRPTSRPAASRGWSRRNRSGAGSRSSYIGSEVFLSLVDSTQAPYSADLRQLSMRALCTNRDLVLQMPIGLGQTDFSLNIAAPVTSVRVVSGPSRPYGAGRRGRDRVADDQPSVAELSVARECHRAAGRDRAARSARALRDHRGRQRQAADRRHPIGERPAAWSGGCRARGPIAFGRGLEITVDVDEMGFEGGSAFLLGAVLDRYFARYVSINSVTETVLRSQSRGEINRWAPNWGTRPTL